jgi:hypothetical protein
MPTLLVSELASSPIYELIGSRVRDEPSRAYAFDLYDAIERERVLRNNQVALGLKEEALITEATRNRHITALSRLMSTH